MRNYRNFLLFALLLPLWIGSSTLQAATQIWNGTAGDGLWQSAGNWSTGTVPTTGDIIIINNGDTVALPATSPPAGAFYFPVGSTFVATGSQLTCTATVARLNPGSYLGFDATSGLSGLLFDLNNGTLALVDGTTFNPSILENRGTSIYNFTLSATGFTPIQPGQFSDTGTQNWSDLTFNIDLSAYDYAANGPTIELIDAGSHTANYNGTFNPTVNITPGATGLVGSLLFDTATSKLILTVNPPGNAPPFASDQSVAVDASAPSNITLTATDPNGDPLTYTLVSSPTNGTLTGTAPNLVYTSTGSSPTDSFTFKANDGTVDSNIATITITPVPQNPADLWDPHYNAILTDGLNPMIHSTWTDLSGTVEISRVSYDLGTLTGNQNSGSPRMVGYLAKPIGGTNLPGIVRLHGGGQRAYANFATFWATQGYACIALNWGGNPLTDEPSGTGATLPNTDWDGLPAGFQQTPTQDSHIFNTFFCDPQVFTDGGSTLYDIAHPMNSGWFFNGYAARRAITYLQNLPEVDGSKIAINGFSMGGVSTMVSATDPRITCLSPAVGGSGYQYSDHWGSPGSAYFRSTSFPDLYDKTISDEAHWAYVDKPIMALSVSNDFNGIFDGFFKGMAVHGAALPGPPTVRHIAASSTHYNHILTGDTKAAEIHWMRHHLKGDIAFPQISDSELQMVSPSGNPIFRVYPDTSAGFPVASVEVYYSQGRYSLERYWNDTPATNAGTHWEAELPLFDANDMVTTYAVIKYDVGFSQTLSPGLPTPTQYFDVLSKIQYYYPTGVDTTSYVFPPNLDTDALEIQHLPSAPLVAAGLEENGVVSRQIDDFSRGYEDWFLSSATNPLRWQFRTRKIHDVLYQGWNGAFLVANIVTSSPNNRLAVQVVADNWNSQAPFTYYAYVTLPNTGLNTVILQASDFARVSDGGALTNWDGVRYVGFMPAQNIVNTEPNWIGTVPTLTNLAWVGGTAPILDNNVPADWLESFNIPMSNEATREDTDGDGCSNWMEFQAGTNPTDPTSCFQVCPTFAAGNINLEWTPVAGKTYHIEFSPDIGTTPWTLYQSNVPYTVGTDVMISIPTTPGTAGFYRVSVQ